MAAEAIKQLIEQFGQDPNLQKLPLPGSLRQVLGLPVEPEPTLASIKEIANKAIFTEDTDSFEIRQCPNIPMPDFDKMAKEFQERYLLPTPESKEEEKIEVIEEGSAAAE